VTALEPVALDLPADAPRTWLLDATGSTLDEAAMREQARQLASQAHARFSSRSYRFPYALVAWHVAPIGVDIERVEPLDPAFLASVSTPEERRSQAAGADPESATSPWSSKEALAKALGDAVEYDPRRLGSPMFWTGGESGPWRALCLPVPSGHVGWLCWRTDAADT
jgi:hypothetical protein